MAVHGNETDQQRDAIGAKQGSWLVSAGAGSGKTRVVTSRFASLLADGDAAIDEILTITFTKKAAGHMMKRIRELLIENGMSEERRSIDRAKISTIHGFCSSVVRQYALMLGLDPGFQVADGDQAEMIKQEAFEAAVDNLVSARGRRAVDLITAYEPNRSPALFKAVREIHGQLRCRGHEKPTIPIPVTIDLEKPRSILREKIKDTFKLIEELRSNPSKAMEKMDSLLEATVETDAAKAIKALQESKPAEQGGAKEGIRRVNQAREALLNAYYSIEALSDLEIIRELLESFSEEYSERKRQRSLLDFEDLELFTLRVLRDNVKACESLSQSFKFIMVDEFQDTNDLQCKIIDLLDRDNVFFVGDVNQSIYRFRNADVGLFQKKRSSLPSKNLLPLPQNFRSQAEILAFVDRLFQQEQMLAPADYIKLEAGAGLFPKKEPYRVEVIIVDGDSADKEKANTELSRRAEGTLIARRLAELKQGGVFDFGDMAILLRSSTGVECYRQALDLAGIPNYVSIGRDYYQKVEFGDALCLLNLLVNPLNDLALLSVLRSPMVGVTDDTLYWLRQLAGRERNDPGRPLWPAIEGKLLAGKIPQEEYVKLDKFTDDFRTMRERSRRGSLESTMRMVIGYNNYSAIVAAGASGRQAYANLMKLVDKGFEYEVAEGRDLAAFTSFLEHQQAEEAAENEAPLEEEESDGDKQGGAVRILTIHSAKGLEFPLVVWANMGYAPDPRKQVLICSGERIGFLQKALGQKDRYLFDYEDLLEEEIMLELAEEKRIGYVAMTRAERHLILCGTSNMDKPSGGAASRNPIEWVRTLLHLEPGRTELEEADVGLTLCTDPETIVEESQECFTPAAGLKLAPVRSDLDVFPERAVFVPSQVNASSLDTFLAAPCRFYLEHVLKMGALLADAGTDRQETPAIGKGSAKATSGSLERDQMGTFIHSVLERRLDSLKSVGSEQIDELAREVLGGDVSLTAADLTLAQKLLNNFKTSKAAEELLPLVDSEKLMREIDFSLIAGQTIIRGKTDAIFWSGERLVVIDYKTGVVSEEDTIEKKAGQYRIQMMCYALAARNMGASEVEIVLAFLDRAGMEARQVFTGDDFSGIENELVELLASMGDLSFKKSSSLDPRLCAHCIANRGTVPLCPTAHRS
ncbi:MAG: UvrD-helicase domain-containing protein [Thermoleophilia bacterium]